MQGFKDILRSRGLLCHVWDERGFTQSSFSCFFLSREPRWLDRYGALSWCFGKHHWMLHTVSWSWTWLPNPPLFVNYQDSGTLSHCEEKQIILFHHLHSRHISTPGHRKLKLSKMFTNSSWNKNIHFPSQRQLKIFIYIWHESLIFLLSKSFTM